jgi:ribonuclease HI
MEQGRGIFLGSHFSIQLPSLSVDAACSGNPGVMEYRGVDTATGREIFRMGPYPDGTNNVGEFLALVHGLSLLKKHNSNLPIYSDSVSAMAWVRAKQCKTKLMRTERNIPLFDLIARAERWLQTNTYTNKILKWDTPNWGEIPADFGRK